VPVSRSELREQDPGLALQTIARLIMVRFGGACSPRTVAD
jgi:hypothetical protein